MNDTPLAGRRALVTGASSGLGADFARELARRGARLVLVARRKEPMDALAREIEAAHGAAADVIAEDLRDPAAPARLLAATEGADKPVDVLVNNAGHGLWGRFLEIPWEKERAMLELDVVALVAMTKAFLPAMVGRRSGFLLQVSSIGAYQPTPLYASYSAAKAFVLSFGEAVNHELKGTGVSCTVVSPGVTATSFLEVAGQKPTPYQRLVMMKSPDVVRIAVDAMLARRATVVPGLLNAVTAWSNRLMPRAVSTAVAGKLME